MVREISASKRKSAKKIVEMKVEIFVLLFCLSGSYTLNCRVCGHEDDDLGICASDSDNGKLEKCPTSLDACWYGSKSKFFKGIFCVIIYKLLYIVRM